MNISITIDENPNLTLGILAQLDCVRSAHVGLLAPQNYTLPALCCGIEVQLHEFLEFSSNADYDVCSFPIPTSLGKYRTIEISHDTKVWGPLAQWNEKSCLEIVNSQNRYSKLAEISASPFSFHVAATKLSFPLNDKVSLSSSALLKIPANSIECSSVANIVLDLLATPRVSTRDKSGGRPTAFYRLIDRMGETHKLTKINTHEINQTKVVYLEYGNGTQIKLTDAAENVMATLREMEQLERNPSTILESRDRIVMDTAFYFVCSIVERFFLRRFDDPTDFDCEEEFTVYHLAGSEMIAYLTTKSAGSDHYVRQINNTYAVLRDNLNLPKNVSFRMVRPIKFVGSNQYTMQNQYELLDKLKPGSSFVV
jgi:hypothetical protein